MSTDNNVDTLTNRYLTFPLGEDTLAIEIKNIIEITGLQNITKVPEVPDYIEGVINMRGRPIPVVNVKKKFNLYQSEDNNYRTNIIVLDIDDVTVGLTVDAVKDVITVEGSEMFPYTKKGLYDDCDYIQSIAKVDGETILFLNCNKLLGIENNQKEML